MKRHTANEWTGEARRKDAAADPQAKARASFAALLGVLADTAFE